MNLKATASFRSGDTTRALANIGVRVKAAITNGANAVLDISRQYVPVRTGKLASSGGVEVDVQGTKIIGTISYTASYAAYNEFGTGKRGAASGHGAPGIEYDPNWPGMPGHPYIRPALDAGRPQVLGAFADQGFKT